MSAPIDKRFDDEEEDEKVPVERDARGRFKGTGNPRGRPSKRPPFEMDSRLPASRRKSIFNVADRKVKVKIDGKEEYLSIFEACALQMGYAGARGDRVAARQMIDLAMSVSQTHLERLVFTASTLRDMDRLREENERLGGIHEKKTGTVYASPEETQARWPDLFAGRTIDDGILDEVLAQEAAERDALRGQKDGKDDGASI